MSVLRSIARDVAKNRMHKRGYKQISKKSEGKKHTSLFASEWRLYVH